MINEILKAREERALLINDYLKSNNVVIVIKANIPGVNKNINEAYLLVNLFKKIVVSNLKLTLLSKKESKDGPFYLFTSNLDENIIKNKLIEIEETHPLGRFIDLDVYTKKGNICRNKVRNCFICDYPFHVCRISNNHSTDELLLFIKESVTNYLEEIILDMINTSMLKELGLHPKFGLVTPFSNGSHKDMDYKLMIKAKDAIIPYFWEMFLVGYTNDSLKTKFKKAKEIGIKAEEAMKKATNNINAYKGLIFILGLVLVSLGHLLIYNQDEPYLYENIKLMCRDIFDDIEKLEKTPGIIYYQKFKFKGARGEAKDGLKSVKIVVDYLDSHQELNHEILTLALIKLLDLTDDSVLLKRSGSLLKYKDNKKLITSIKEYDKKKVEEITTYCIKNNLSLGGCADLLITSVFIHLIKKILI